LPKPPAFIVHLVLELERVDIQLW